MDRPAPGVPYLIAKQASGISSRGLESDNCRVVPGLVVNGQHPAQTVAPPAAFFGHNWMNHGRQKRAGGFRRPWPS